MKNSKETTTQEVINVEILKSELELLKEKQKELRDQLKELNQKEKKAKKGVPVTFKNKAGETITGLGVIYYVVNLKGKLHYKQAEQVELLPEDTVITE